MNAVYLLAALTLALTRESYAFSQPRLSLVNPPSANIGNPYHLVSLAMSADASADGEDNVESDEMLPEPQSNAGVPIPNRPPPAQKPRLDPLIASLTRMDPTTTSAETTKVPLIGEIPKDGSIIPLGTAAAIALLGFIMSINIAVNSKDAILAQVQDTTDGMSTPPVMKTAPAKDDGCRGLCSSQEQDLDNLRNFMVKLSK
mmetsp:Transcript_18409/g.53081  ORF Transcript_18409/g.53081 Transcript_18409/m.53081 type:complete len:201 (-) Transcript_18409:111-713(-)|eukprot:CAMPEP_0113560894 /NCGR_PEP_ID=MMETSP0015_2-20120614/19686_1 /TAXON_ID=2838 /ORGANISM="Odontella" /LENGTH=200 /DNA_ID=CAMNT_0000462653 /DNA_START=113 /DNA_END=715 /DNA_ORIENTATION=+ /assembly_acc=CAM_ASM_000160